MNTKKKEQPTKICRVDGVIFSKPPHLSFDSWANRICCSKVCGATKPNPDGTYGFKVKVCANSECRQLFTKPKKDTHEHFARQEYCSISCSKIGKNSGIDNNNWKGDDVGYSGVHAWMRKTYGNPQYCEHCGKTARRMHHWANKTGKYLRDRDDWLRLCVPHHRKYDNERRSLSTPSSLV